ncbi:MAG: hypothetical protein ABSE84_12905, partial [Isosphaeraceae bacterium]
AESRKNEALRAGATWAQVAESFKAEKFVSATIYTKSDAAAQPEETELWLARGGLARMCDGAAMIFAPGDARCPLSCRSHRRRS